MVSPQTWNRYSYCYNNPLTLIDENGKWPTGTHNRILAKALDGMRDDAPKLLAAVQSGSRKVDRDGTDVKTMKESNAPQHAMTPASYITASCNLDCAKGMARQAAYDFVAGNLKSAKAEFDKVKNMADGDAKFEGIKKSLEFFGAATHAIMDNRSPAHSNFQVFDGSETTKIVAGTVIGGVLGGPIGAAAGAAVGGRNTLAHINTESRDPTDDEQNAMEDEIRTAFQQVYGQDSYNNSVSESQRRETAGRQKSKDMLIP